MSSKFGQIGQGTAELLMYDVVNTLAHISDEYEIRPDQTKDCGVIDFFIYFGITD